MQHIINLGCSFNLCSEFVVVFVASLFYKQQLLDGVTEEQRKPLLVSITCTPAIVIVHQLTCDL